MRRHGFHKFLRMLRRERESAFSLSRLYPGTVCIEEVRGDERDGWIAIGRIGRGTRASGGAKEQGREGEGEGPTGELEGTTRA